MQAIIRQKLRYQRLASSQIGLSHSRNFSLRLGNKPAFNNSQKDQSSSGQFMNSILLGSTALMLSFYGLQQKKALAEEASGNGDDNGSGAENETCMEEITPQNLKEIMNSKENKFIYFYHSKALNTEQLKKVDEHAQKMQNGMRIQPYKLDLDCYQSDFITFLKERNPKTADQVEQQISSNSFLLSNQFDDIWFWEMDLINYFYGDLLEQIFNFYQGPLRLISEEQLIMNQSLENDFHVITYIDDFNNDESIKKLKNFRKFNTKNTDKFFHFKIWIVEDKELAQRLKIDTDPQRIGDVYLVRQSTQFNSNKKNIQLSGYDYNSERILTFDEIQNDIQKSYAKILQFAFNSPIIVHDYMSFAMLQNKFKTNTFVIYCDKKDKKLYQQILRAMIKARKNLPINLQPDDSGELKKQQRHNDVIFVLSTVRNLMPVAKLHEEKPQALFVTPDDNIIDLFNTTMSSVEKVEGVSKEEYFKKAFNNDTEFAYSEKDDDKERNRKDTLKLIYSPDRFLMPKMYHSDNLEVLTDQDKMTQFVKATINGETPLYWETEKVPKTYYSQKVVGEDFEKRVLDAKRDCLVLVTHPQKHKNRQLLEQYEQFVKDQATINGISKDDQIVYARYNGINESTRFRSPQKLPALLYFKKVENQGEKDVVEFQDINSLLLKSTNEDKFNETLKQFLNAQNKKQ